MGIKRRNFAVLATALAGLLAGAPAHAETVLKAVMNSDLKILDPIWTTAYVQRSFGYMVWDVLFAVDDKFQVKPQMVDKYDVSADKLTWTFTLRDGLEWHDGTPVTSEDVVPSLKRWAVRDPLGQALWTKVNDIKAVDLKTFQILLKAPTGASGRRWSIPTRPPPTSSPGPSSCATASNGMTARR